MERQLIEFLVGLGVAEVWAERVLNGAAGVVSLAALGVSLYGGWRGLAAFTRWGYRTVQRRAGFWLVARQFAALLFKAEPPPGSYQIGVHDGSGVSSREPGEDDSEPSPLVAQAADASKEMCNCASCRVYREEQTREARVQAVPPAAEVCFGQTNQRAPAPCRNADARIQRRRG